MHNHCCSRMTEILVFKCQSCSSPFDCPDSTLFYNEKFDEYGIIIHDGGPSYILIQFCPFCGLPLPKSKRDLWFTELNELGFDDPFIQEIPEAYQSDKWYVK